MSKVSEQMNMVSDLIENMRNKGATKDELARVIRYSQDILDSEKYDINLNKSFCDYGIKELISKYN